ncbi:MAG: hypothetical protein DYG92_10550 [Leptolyngbya sp. PLA1]|nr:hypothetical protein [Leptolyngbya sp. PLA1]
MKKMSLIAAIATLACAGAANAGVYMSFADPIPGRQLRNTANAVEAGVGRMTYDQSATFDFFIDGTDLGFGPVTITGAHMEMDMAIGAAAVTGSATVAPVAGFFTIYIIGEDEVRRDVIRGLAGDGAFVRVGNTNALLFSDPDFEYQAGPVLEALNGGPVLFADPTEAVFTLTSIAPTGGGSFLNGDGTFKSFDANASFTGNAEVVPAPGAIALAGLGGLCMLRRRRA